MALDTQVTSKLHLFHLTGEYTIPYPEKVRTVVYSPREERINVISHTIGFVLSCIALVLLSTHGALSGKVAATLSFVVYGLSLLVLYGASTLYHASSDPQRRSRLRVIDHAAIYVLIAGTYTPFMVVVLNSSLGWIILSVGWAMAVAGSILKIWFTGRYQKLSTSMYVAMGWLVVFAINPLRQNLEPDAMFWLVAGGLS